MLSSEDALIDGVEDDDFLVRMDDDDSNNASLGFLEDQGNRCESLPALYDPPRSPSPSRSHTSAHEITPEQQEQGKVHLQNPGELQVQYKRTLKKLAKSIRQSDATRSQIKRQKRLASASLSDSEDDCDFFTSRRCMELEKSRKQLLKLIAMQAACNDDKTSSV